MTVRSEARIRTDAAERYAKQMCHHANHMGVSAHWTPPDGVVEFPQGGIGRLTAGPDELVLLAEAETPGQLATIQSIIGADFARFGH